MKSEASALATAFLAVQGKGDSQPGVVRDLEPLDALAVASGIDDRGVLQALADLGVTADTIAALALVPLVLVAWADGRVAREERIEIIRAARETGLVPGDAYHTLVESWIQEGPGDGLLPIWKAYVAALASELVPEVFRTLRDQLLERATRVAAAEGSRIRGLGSRISRLERELIVELRAAFD